MMIRWLHLVAASVWVGGLITLGALVVTLRRQEVERHVVGALARQFARLSWTAMAVLVFTGAWMAIPYLGTTVLTVKIALVGLVIGLAGWHQLAAPRQSPAVRGALQGAILVVSLAIVAVAVAL